MNVLFVHRNFPGQFLRLAPALAARPGCRVMAIGEGGVARRTYGFIGSEIDLQRRGAIIAGSLDAVKSRILLALLLAAGADADQIATEFELRGARC